MIEGLEQLIPDSRPSVELGVAQAPPTPSARPSAAQAARHCLVQLVPDGRLVEARVANIGQGFGKGIFAPIQAGDEVLVLLPGGDPNRAIVLGGLGNAKAPNPIGNTGLSMLLQHPAGVRLGTTDGQPEHGIVHGQHLVDLDAFLSALDTYLQAVALAVDAAAVAASSPPIVPAAQTAWEAAFGAFAAQVSASATSGTAPGVGGPPHATTLHKVTP